MDEKAFKDVSNMTFEEAMKELEDIVSGLESSELSLEKALELFKRGVALSSHCNKKLETAQGEINMLIKNREGDLEEVKFNIINEENDDYEL